MPVSIGKDEFDALKDDEAFWARVGALAADGEEHSRVEGEWLAARGIDGEALRAWASYEAIDDLRSTGMIALPGNLRALVGAAIASGYHLGFIVGVEMRGRAQS